MSPERWQQIERLYHATLERPATERAAYLTQACAADSDLRREVERLLAANAQLGSFLDTPVLHLQARQLAAEAPTAPLRQYVGQQFGHYQVRASLGAGGMGEVYLAQDTRLERRVALKFLPDQFTQDPERLQRFIREAKATSSLNHPNIITIYEIGEAFTEPTRTHFIATEFVAGQTLRAWQPPDETQRVAQVLSFGVQIASALEAAHQAGIIHRDIKPENLMLRPDGFIKVLDFGLAKLTPPFSAAETTLGHSAPTRSAQLQTEPGMILGTLRYMSPEQARGQALDQRTDIFSLGVVLYELLTQAPLFGGDSSADVIAAILHKTPTPLGEVLPAAPAELERILQKALAKDAPARYQTMRDLQTELQQLQHDLEFAAQLVRSGQTTTAARNSAQQQANSPAAPSTRWRWLAAAGVLSVLLSGLGWRLWQSPARPVSRPTPRLTKLTDTRITSGQNLARPSFSPDGKLIAYSLSQDGTSHLWIRQLTGDTPKQISTGNWNDRDPVWSPDGQQLAFLSNRGGTPGIWATHFLGETPRLLQPLELSDHVLRGWSIKSQTLYLQHEGNLLALDLGTGQRTRLTDFDARQAPGNDFALSPNEEWLAYTTRRDGQARVMVKPLRGGTPQQITFGAGHARSPVWFPDNQHLAYCADSGGRYQLYLGTANGQPPELLLVSDDNQEFVTVSPAGGQLITSGNRQNANLVAYDLRTGQETNQSTDFGLQLYPELSPDGHQLLYQATNANINLNEALMLKSLEPGSSPFKLTAPGFHAKWSPQGEVLAFLRYSANQTELRKVSSSGRNEQLLASQPSFSGQTAMPYYRLGAAFDWSPDGKQVLYHSTKSGADNLWTVAADGSHDTPLTQFTEVKDRLVSPCWSPDGQHIAFLKTSFGTGQTRLKSVWLLTAGQPPVVLFSTEQGLHLLGWSASGQELWLATRPNLNLSAPALVTVLKLRRSETTPTVVGQIPAAYFYSVTLAPNRQSLAAISRETGQDNLVTLQLANGTLKRHSKNPDSTLYFAGLSWAPDGKTLYVSKQSEWLWLSLLENFD